MTPEKVGHKLKSIGLFTRTLSQVGRGLLMDASTVARIHQIAKAYDMEDASIGPENLNCGFCAQDQ